MIDDFLDDALMVGRTRYGAVIYPRTDPYIGRSIREYGEFSETEVTMFRHFVQAGDTVLDIGANFGCHTLALASLVGDRGAVYAFEPQRTVYWLLCANIAINARYRVRPFHAALSDTVGGITVPMLPYAAPVNFGGLSLLDPGEGERVSQLTVDALGLPRVAFMKLDVEHMESRVLRGAQRTIERDRPVVYFEAATPAERRQTMAELDGFGYRCAWHFAPLYNPDNVCGNPEPMDELVSRNVLAVPPGVDFPSDPYLFAPEVGDAALEKE